MFAVAYFVLLVGLVQAGPDEIHPDLQEIADRLHDTCVQESGTTEELIKQANTGNFPEDQSFKCYILCLYDKSGVFNHDDGTIDVAGCVAQVPESLKEIYQPAIQNCGTILGADSCDTASKTAYCIYTNTKDHFYLI